MKVLKGALIAVSAAAVMAVLSAAPAAAAPINFTWTPSAVGLTGGAVTNANNFNVTDFATITVVDAGGDFTENGALNVTGFLNGGTAVSSTGLGSTYSLYYVFNGSGNQGGAIPTTLGQTTTGTYNTLNYTLYASTTGAPTFTVTPAGVVVVAPGSFALGYGSLVGGGNTVSLTLTGGGLSPHSDVTVSLNPCLAAGQGGVCTANEGLFFTSPSATTGVLQFGDFGATGTVTTSAGNQVFINGGGGNITEALAPVPEPVTLSLFGAGLAGAAFARRRKSKKA